MLADRKMSSKELAEAIGTTQVNISRIKTGQIRGIRFNTLYEICKALDCQPGDLLECVIDDEGLDDAG
jgi:putative transcriptional regulator